MTLEEGSIQFDPVQDVREAHMLEKMGYHEEEAATLEQLQYRHDKAPHLFIGAFAPSMLQGRSLVGFIVATASIAERLEETAMKRHDTDGTNICIHSVCVAPPLRRRGIALSLLHDLIARLKSQTILPLPHKVSLISHAHLMPLYEKAGFVSIGESNIVHGPEKWFEMQLQLK